MSLYAPLNSEGPAIPTLDQIRTGQHTVDVEMQKTEPAPALAPKTKQPLVVESVAVLSITETAAPAPYDRWLVQSCCCGCSLATGVWLIALLEAVSWATGILTGIFALVLESQKKQIDAAIEKSDAEESEEPASASESGSADSESADFEDMSTEEKISHTNHVIDALAIASPFILAMALVGLFFAFKGFKASRGDLAAAKSYFWWRKVAVVYAAIALVIGESGFFGGLVGLLVAVYYATVVRSHMRALDKEQAPAPAETTTTFVTVNAV